MSCAFSDNVFARRFARRKKRNAVTSEPPKAIISPQNSGCLTRGSREVQ
jgi:hypothetical protein